MPVMGDLKKNTKKTQTKNKIVFGLFLSFLLIINFPSLVLLFNTIFNYHQWNEKTFIALLIIWLFFNKFKKEHLVYKLSYRVRFLLLAIFLNILGVLSDIQFFLWAGLSCSIYSCLVYFFGYKSANKFIPLLLLTLYIGRLNSPTTINIISMYFRVAATYVATLLLKLIAIPAVNTGSTFIATPKLTFVISDACSGLNNVISLTFLGFLWGYIKNFNLPQMLKTGLLALVLAFLSNSFRIFSLIGLGYYGGENLTAPTSPWHVLIGIFWFIFFLSWLIYSITPKKH